MKLLLTSAGYEKNPIIEKEFLKLINKKPFQAKVFLITTAKRKDKDWPWVKFTLKQLEKLGFLPRNISVFSFDRIINREDLFDKDVVYVCGGNTFLYLDRIKKTGLDKIIKEFVKKGKVYFGVSAGSYVACPTIEAASWKHADRNIISLKNLKGLNLVPFLITAHFNKELRPLIQKAAEHTKYPVIALTDEQAVLVKNKSIKIIGNGQNNIFNSSKKF